jgi:hypothetical protein
MRDKIKHAVSTAALMAFMAAHRQIAEYEHERSTSPARSACWRRH